MKTRQLLLLPSIILVMASNTIRGGTGDINSAFWQTLKNVPTSIWNTLTSIPDRSIEMTGRRPWEPKPSSTPQMQQYLPQPMIQNNQVTGFQPVAPTSIAPPPGILESLRNKISGAVSGGIQRAGQGVENAIMSSYGLPFKMRLNQLQRAEDQIQGATAPTPAPFQPPKTVEEFYQRGFDKTAPGAIPYLPTPTPVSTSIGTTTPKPYDDLIDRIFGSEATNAKRVLDEGENRSRGAGPEMDISNEGYSTPSIVKLAHGDVMGKDGKWYSLDRGLFRINNRTFADYLNRYPEELFASGIYNWDDMWNPEKNIRMAKIIFDKRGWSQWHAAPQGLVSPSLARQ